MVSLGEVESLAVSLVCATSGGFDGVDGAG